LDPRAQAPAAPARFQVTETSVGDRLQRIAGIAFEATSAADVGVTMLGGDVRPTTATHTGDGGDVT
jgi:hypothetical protein